MGSTTSLVVRLLAALLHNQYLVSAMLYQVTRIPNDYVINNYVEPAVI